MNFATKYYFCYFFFLVGGLLFTATLVSGQNCEELIPRYNRLELNRINLLFLGMGYQNQQRLVSLLQEVIDLNSNKEGFFSIEPFKSNKNKFNVWYSISPDQPEGRVALLALKEKLIAACNETMSLPHLYVITYSNKPSYAGRVGVGDPEGGTATIFWEEKNEKSIKIREDHKYVFLHEFGAHAFARLYDEYVAPSNESYSERKRASDNINCFVGSYEECLAASPWQDLIGRGCGDPQKLDCLADDPDAYREVGCYEGCRLFSTGAFRPHRESVLTFQNAFLGLMHQREICRKIQEITSQATGYCYEEFGIGIPASAEEPSITDQQDRVPPTSLRRESVVQPTSWKWFMVSLAVGSIFILLVVVIILLRRRNRV